MLSRLHTAITSKIFRKYKGPQIRYITTKRTTKTSKSMNNILAGVYGLLTLDEINKAKWLVPYNFEEYHGYFLTTLKNKNEEEKLSPDAIAYMICDSLVYLQGFIMHIIQNDDIDLFCEVIKNNQHLCDVLFKNSSSKMKSILAQYLFKNLEKIKIYPQVVDHISYSSELFSELLVDKILEETEKNSTKNDSEHNKNKMDVNLYSLDYISWHYLLKSMSDDKKHKMFNLMLENIDRMPEEIILVSLDLNHNFGDDCFKDKISDYMINNFKEGNNKLLQRMSGYYWHVLLDSERRSCKWRKFVLNNKDKVFEINRSIFEHFINTNDKTFLNNLIQQIFVKNQ